MDGSSNASGYDAIVVGGDHNGLVCAASLARAGIEEMSLDQPLSVRPTPEFAGYRTPVGGVVEIPGPNASKVVIGDHKNGERRERLRGGCGHACAGDGLSVIVM